MDYKKPSTQREMVERMWYAIYGSNGDSIWSIVKDIDHRLDRLEKRNVAIVAGAGITVTLLNIGIALIAYL